MPSATHELIDISEPNRWTAALVGIPHGPAHRWDFAAAMHATSGAPTQLYRYERGESVVVCPLAERAIEDRIDVTTPLGFSGFAGMGPWESFERDWRSFATDQRWVCAYVGLHPVFHDASAFLPENVHIHNELFLLDLTASEADLLQRMSRKRRRQLRDWPAIRAQLVLDKVELSRFLVAAYPAFFLRRGAGEATDLAGETLRRIADMPNILLVGAQGEAGMEAVLAVAYTSYCADAVFSVSVPGGETHGAHLNWFVVEYLREIGVPTYNMGGGVKTGDSIAEFKRRFGAAAHPLRSVRQIFDADTYGRLCAARGIDPDPTQDAYFPAYRR